MPVKTVHPAPGISSAFMSPPSPMVAKARISSQKPSTIGRVISESETLKIRMSPRMISISPPTAIQPRPVTKWRFMAESAASSMPERNISHPNRVASAR